MASQKFRDLDDPTVFAHCWSRLQEAQTQNLAVSFDNEQANCALNLSCTEIDGFLTKPGSSTNTTRWLNFWGGHAQKDDIKTIARRYGVSPRLLNLLCPETPVEKTGPSVNGRPIADLSIESSSRASHKPASCKDDDAEKGLPASTPSSPKDEPPTKMREKHDAIGNIVDDLWHFCSVDRGQRYLYIGYNSLFPIPDDQNSPATSKPAGLRVWTSLLLCGIGRAHV